VSPALADDLSGLPTTYIDTGSAEVFRDEDTDYATRIWAAGGQAELHVWASGFHGFDALYPLHTSRPQPAEPAPTDSPGSCPRTRRIGEVDQFRSYASALAKTSASAVSRRDG